MKTWKDITGPILQTPRMQEMKAWLTDERTKKNIYPASQNTFAAFNLCPYENVRTVIIGQDPYHQPGVADGLVFSTQQPARPPSLKFIFQEIYDDLNIQWRHNLTMNEYFPSNSLIRWAQNGFLLLNAALTVEEAKPRSHMNIGWEILLDEVIKALNEHERQIIFLLWGKDAQALKPKIDESSGRHLVFEAPHPAAEAYREGAGFIGCRHFSIIRDILPTLNGEWPGHINLKPFIHKDRLKEFVKKEYPDKVDEIRKQFKEFALYLPLRADKFYDKQRQFEVNLSTNVNYNTYGTKN